ncbi:hypothetical protein BH160DRAFT_7127 [Burkholderia sp. H160]|nr:hypothetical protein BH160DRAFT_7127 [Burkholderia sp. H160]
MNFFSYWKEISIVLAAVFALCGALADVRDKRTNKITPWGRWFFALTVLSMFAGVYSQWLDDDQARVRNNQTQAYMVRLLQSEEKNIRDLSRILQPIDVQSVLISLAIRCDESRFDRFCGAARTLAKKQNKFAHRAPDSFSAIDDIDWDLWPNGDLHSSIFIYFFSGDRKIDKYISNDCAMCSQTADLYLAFSSASQAGLMNYITVFYQPSTEKLILWLKVDARSVQEILRSDKVLSIQDIPHSTLIMDRPGLFDGLDIIEISIHTTRGQYLVAYPKVKMTGARGIFLYQFGEKLLENRDSPPNVFYFEKL